MLIARFQIEARFGHKQRVIEHLNRWFEEVGSQAGLSPNRVRRMTGSIGACESMMVMEVEVDSLADLQAAWDKMNSLPAHAKLAQELEPYIVSGSNKWEVYRKL